MHSYSAEGIYTEKLVVTDQYGCTDSLIHPGYIKIAYPHASYTLSDSVGTCPPLFVSFGNTSQNFSSAVWDFGDGTTTTTDNPSHFYNIPGTYFAKLSITSPGGCTDVIQKKITILGPQGLFTYGPVSGCKPLTVNFTGNTHNRLSFIWDYNDGTTIATTDSVMSYTYTIPAFMYLK